MTQKEAAPLGIERRKALESARRYEEGAVRHLAGKLRILRETGLLGSYPKFLQGCGLDSKLYKKDLNTFLKHLSRFVRCSNIANQKAYRAHHPDLLDEGDYQRVVERLFSDKLWYPEALFEPPPTGGSTDADYRPPHLQHALLPDSVFHAVSRFIGMDREPNGVSHTRDTDDLRASFAGDYNVYRFSTIALGRVLVGKLSVAWDPDTRAIVTDEDYAIPNLELSFHLDGFLFGYDRRYRLLSRHGKSRQPQVIFIHDLDRANDLEVHHMTGVAADIQNNGRLYATRVVFLRITGERPAAEIGTATLEEIPDYARTKLCQRPIQLGDYIVEF